MERLLLYQCVLNNKCDIFISPFLKKNRRKSKQILVICGHFESGDAMCIFLMEILNSTENISLTVKAKRYCSI